MSIFSVLTFGIISLLSLFDIIVGIVFFIVVITLCRFLLIKRCKQASHDVGDPTEVLCTHPRSVPISSIPTIPFYNTPILNTTSTSPTIIDCSIPLYNTTSTITSPIDHIHSFHSNTYPSCTLPTSPMSSFACSTPNTSTLPLPPFYNKSCHYMVSKLY